MLLTSNHNPVNPMLSRCMNILAAVPVESVFPLKQDLRRAQFIYPRPEASAKTADNAYIYLTKRGDRWFMNELVSADNDKNDTRLYFDDPKYKAPE